MIYLYLGVRVATGTALSVSSCILYELYVGNFDKVMSLLHI